VILTGREIERQVKLGRIEIDPFDSRRINPNSYNFRLGRTIKWYREDVLDVRKHNDTEMADLGSDGMILSPDRIYLGHTEEVMGSDYFVPIIRARSSVARLGLFIHVTSDLIDIGSHNQWTLQLHAVQPLRVIPGLEIGQVTFWTIEGEVSLYRGKYQGCRGPQESRSYEDWVS
jgi:dCTP deaminase